MKLFIHFLSLIIKALFGGMVMKKWFFAIIVVLVAFFTVACGFMVDEFRWEEGHGELPEVVGSEDVSLEGMLVPEYSDFVDFNNFVDKTPYEKQTDQWFGAGKLGYGIPAGTMKAGEEFEIVLFGHDPDGFKVDRNMRIQLHEINEGYELGDLILEEEIFVDEVDGTEEIYRGQLPDVENVSYIVSLEVLDGADKVEDTLLGLVYVPGLEVNAKLSLSEELFEYVDDAKEREEVFVTLSLENFGPTFLSLGKSFVIEKLVEDTWRVAPLGLSFESIGIHLGINDTYEQTYDVSELRRGTYRFVKEFSVDGLDEKQTLAVEFKVE